MIPEVVNQVAFRVIGNDLTITLASEAGQLELNVMEPIIVHSLFENIEMLVNAMNTLREKCVVGITANPEVCRRMVYNSIGLVTALNPYLGYETSTMLAKEALQTGKGIYDLVLEHRLMSEEELTRSCSPRTWCIPARRSPSDPPADGKTTTAASEKGRRSRSYRRTGGVHELFFSRFSRTTTG